MDDQYTMKSKQEIESENIIKCYIYLDIFICPKASSIAFASAEHLGV